MTTATRAGGDEALLVALVSGATYNAAAMAAGCSVATVKRRLAETRVQAAPRRV